MSQTWVFESPTSCCNGSIVWKLRGENSNMGWVERYDTEDVTFDMTLEEEGRHARQKSEYRPA